MDTMRASLMILGVVLHSAQIFNPESNWLISSVNSDQLMTHIVNLVSTFRMPAFFIVSGYFCYLTIKKYQLKKFFQIRLKRLLIPFGATAITLNSLQAWFLDWSKINSFSLIEYLTNGEYISHLWFLVNLMVYFTVAAILKLCFKPALKAAETAVYHIFTKIHILVIILLMPFCSIIILAANKVGFPLYSNYYGVFDTASILIYSPFFLFGIAIATGKDLIYRFCSINPIICLMIIFVTKIVALFIESYDTTFSTIILSYVTVLSKWLYVQICFFIFFNYLNKQTNFFRMLSDASYTVFLFHHIMVVILGALLIRLDSPAILGFLGLVFAVSVLSLLLHKYVISRIEVLKFLFNGK